MLGSLDSPQNVRLDVIFGVLIIVLAAPCAIHLSHEYAQNYSTVYLPTVIDESHFVKFLILMIEFYKIWIIGHVIYVCKLAALYKMYSKPGYSWLECHLRSGSTMQSAYCLSVFIPIVYNLLISYNVYDIKPAVLWVDCNLHISHKKCIVTKVQHEWNSLM